MHCLDFVRNLIGHPAVRSVSMRDMGTEMTPIPSQEPSRNATPVGATTPLRSPSSSVPSTPRRGAPAPTPNGQITDDESHSAMQNRKRELSEEELKLKTRKEIVALGVQLGKMNIAAWASKDEKAKNTSAVESLNAETLKRIEFEKRAAAWEEAEKTRHTARFLLTTYGLLTYSNMHSDGDLVHLASISPVVTYRLAKVDFDETFAGISTKKSKSKHGRVSRKQNSRQR